MGTLDLQQTATGDLAFTNGDVTLVDDPAQRLAQRLRFVKGEWFLDATAGVPYLDTILKKGPNLGHVRSAFRAAILGTEGVSDVDELELDFDRNTRRLSLSFTALGPNGAATRVSIGGDL